jgi:hypothetical protein
MKLSISEVLKRCSELDTVEKRKLYLLQNDSPAIQYILKCFFDPKIKFLLPEGKAPYKPSDLDRQEGRLYAEARKMYLFIEGGQPNLTKLKREQLFIDLLEGIDAQDAALIVAMKDKKIPYKGITRNLVEKTYPGLLDT